MFISPLVYTGIYSFILVILIVVAIAIIVGSGSRCDDKPNPTCTASNGTLPPGCVSQKDCCKGTWEKFYSSVPLTISIFTIVALVFAFIFVYFGKYI